MKLLLAALQRFPAQLFTDLRDRKGLWPILSSSVWLGSEKLVRLAVGLFVGVWIARYLGPEQYGLLGYALAFAALWQPLSALGLDTIVVRDLVRKPDQSARLLGTAFSIKLLGGLLTTVAAAGSVMVVRPAADELPLIVGFFAATAIAQSADVVDFWFQSRVRPRPVVIARNCAFLAVSTSKIGLILLQAPLVAFALASFAEAMLAAVFLVIAYRPNEVRMRSWRIDCSLALRLLSESWALALSAASIMIYMRLDQVMLGQMVGDHAVGIFTAAARITEVLYVLPMIVVASAAPGLIRAREHAARDYEAGFLLLFRYLSLSGLVLAIPVSLSAALIIELLYGSPYAEAAAVLKVHVWALVFVCLGVAQSRWFVIEGLAPLAFYRAGLGAVVNVVLNLALIPRFGPIGAAFATLAAQFSSAVLFNALSSRARPMLRLQWAALTLRRVG